MGRGGQGSFENTFIQRLRNFLSALRRSPLIPREEGGGGGRDRESRRLPPRLNFSRGEGRKRTRDVSARGNLAGQGERGEEERRGDVRDRRKDFQERT